MRFALYSATYKIGFPGWPEPILDSVTGFGASIKKRGLAPAPFSIFKASFPVPTSSSSRALEEFPPGQILVSRFLPGFIAYQKMSGRWGERPLGRGDGGYCNQKLVRAFRPFRCAREQQDDTQEQTSHNRCRTPENPANFRLLAQFVLHGL